MLWLLLLCLCIFNGIDMQSSFNLVSMRTILSLRLGLDFFLMSLPFCFNMNRSSVRFSDRFIVYTKNHNQTVTTNAAGLLVRRSFSLLKESKWFPGIAFYIGNRNLLIDIAHQVPLSLFFSSHGFFKEKLSPTISSTRDASQQQLAPPGPSTLWCRMVLIMIKPRLVPTSWRRTILQRPTFSNANCSSQLASLP